MVSYSKLPAGATLDVKPFHAHINDIKLQEFQQLLKLSPIAPPVYENTNVGRKYGITSEWLENAKAVWLRDFDWRSHEDRINGFPNFKATVLHEDGSPVEIQFLALFSERADAVPVALLHGWPGSICEFLDILDLVKARYSPGDLPYHIIIPSLPGYAFSSGPPIDRDYDIGSAAGAINDLMVGLGFESGYFAQGGDLGSFVSRILALKYESCKGIHVNMMGMPPELSGEMNESERAALQKATETIDTGYAFALEQGTRPATIGHVLSSSPLALLSW
jgi:pimeloyl-ACP methyl ester carboxylesterase